MSERKLDDGGGSRAARRPSDELESSSLASTIDLGSLPNTEPALLMHTPAEPLSSAIGPSGGISSWRLYLFALGSGLRSAVAPSSRDID